MLTQVTGSAFSAESGGSHLVDRSGSSPQGSCSLCDPPLEQSLFFTSLRGWGAQLVESLLSGQCSPQEQVLHITHQMLNVFLVSAVLSVGNVRTGGISHVRHPTLVAGYELKALGPSLGWV